MRIEEGDHRRVASGQRPQLGVVERIRQAAHVEDEVGVERQAMLEAEGLEQQRQALCFAVRSDEVLDHRAQRVGLEIAGVDAVAEVEQGVQRLALAGDRLGERAVAVGHRVAAARFREALDQHLVARVEKDEAHRDAGGLELLQLLRQGRDRGAAAHVGRHGDTRMPGAAQVGEQFAEQRRRQVVDAVVAGVLQHVERDGFARTGKTADERKLHGETG